MDMVKEYERFKLQWMLDHGYTLQDLIDELDKCLEEAEEGTSLQQIFEDWEFGFGFHSEIWPCFAEYLESEHVEFSNVNTAYRCWVSGDDGNTWTTQHLTRKAMRDSIAKGYRIQPY